jgi:serine/threonine-protein kinase
VEPDGAELPSINERPTIVIRTIQNADRRSAGVPDRRSAPAAPRMPIVEGRYALASQLGSGSTTLVYAANDLRLERPVTVKLFEPAVAADPSLRARFRQQAGKAARLRHPHIAAVLDAGFTRDLGGGERPYVVTEPAGALTLRALLERQGTLSPQHALRLARQVASALSYAHARQVVHADLKPENVLLDASADNAKLVDFSLSFVSAQTGAITPQTLVRRAAYLAPEQVRGEPVGPAADVYALGVLLYEMLVGRPPFVGSSPRATAELRVTEQARPSGLFEPSIPPALDATVSRALERPPRGRWPSMQDFDAQLARLERDPSTAATGRSGAAAAGNPAMAHAPKWPARRRHARPLALAVPIVAIFIALLLVSSYLLPAIASIPRFSGMIPQSPAVPQLVGMTVEEARARLGERGLTLAVVGERLTDNARRGTIVQQSPVADREIDPSQPVRVTVSAGVKVPDLIGKPLPEAEVAASAVGWKIARADRGQQPGAKPNTVLIQSPAPWDTVDAPGELAVVVAE